MSSITAPERRREPSTEQLSLFRERLPRRPYCSDDGTARLIRVSQHALRHRYIQHSPPHLLAWLVYDIDHSNARWEWADAGLPVPAWICCNPHPEPDGLGCRGHVAYGLRVPVARCEAARQEPLRLAAAIESAYTHALRADAAFAGFVTKNPCHPHWQVWTPSAANVGIYDLSELAEHVRLPSVRDLRRARRETQGLGRNVALFDGLRRWAYRAIRAHWRPGGYDAWHQAVTARAAAMNDFPQPLPAAEVGHTATSIAKWTWRHITPSGLRELIDRTHTPERQAVRGARKGAAKRAAALDQARQLAAQGRSQRQIAETLGVTQKTISNWLRRSGE